MVILKALNSSVLSGVKFSYLSTNYLSGVTSLVVSNGSGFAIGDYLLLGEFGSETAEIVLVSNVATNTLTVGATKFSHPESTKVTIIKFNQVKFYYTTTAVFSTVTLLDTLDIQADDLYTKYYDTVHSTGFGWFIFYNSTAVIASSNSSAIPYGDFESGSVKQLLDTFYSLLNQKELTVITQKDALRWLNEAHTVATNELNMSNQEYNVASKYTITVASGTQEYALPTDFSELISIVDDEGEKIPYKSLRDALDDDDSSINTYYYLRGAYIGFWPLPDVATTVDIFYVKKATALTSNYDNLNYPDDNFYFLVDGMMIRACIKLNRNDLSTFEKKFQMGIDRMKLTAHKQSNNPDSFGLDYKASI